MGFGRDSNPETEEAIAGSNGSEIQTMAVGKSPLALTGLIVATVFVAFGVLDGALLGMMQGFTPGYVLAVGAGLAVAGWWLVRLAAHNQVALVAAMQKLAAGDLSVSLGQSGVSPQATESLSRVATSLRTQRESIEALAPVVADLADQVRAVSERCRSALSSTANGTHEAEVAISELLQAVQEVASSAVAAADSTHQAANESNSGKVIMTEAMGAMASLGDHMGRASQAVARLGKESENIGAVLDVIRGIAEQTNLLALNAAIEAARAGEQGRGFAVVADEVRTLASRTQRSTQEIQQMIERLQGEAHGVVEVMSDGTSQASVVEELIENACISLAEIGGAVSSIEGMNNQIASATEQQHAAVTSIQGMVVTRGARGAALQKALEDLEEIAMALDSASAHLA